MAERVADVGDLWADLASNGQSLSAPIEQLQRLGRKLEVPTIRRFGAR
jgi:hypothetical protein